MQPSFSDHTAEYVAEERLKTAIEYALRASAGVQEAITDYLDAYAAARLAGVPENTMESDIIRVAEGTGLEHGMDSFALILEALAKQKAVVNICKPVFCPSCANFTLHKGRCEYDGCRYAPRDNLLSWDATADFGNIMNHLELIPGLSIQLYLKPFPRVAVTGQNENRVTVAATHTMQKLHPAVTVWKRTIKGAYGLENWYGFDLTHDAAKPFLEAIGPRVLHKPSYAPK